MNATTRLLRTLRGFLERGDEASEARLHTDMRAWFDAGCPDAPPDDYTFDREGVDLRVAALRASTPTGRIRASWTVTVDGDAEDVVHQVACSLTPRKHEHFRKGKVSITVSERTWETL